MKTTNLLLITLIVISAFSSCKATKTPADTTTGEFLTAWMPSAPAVIYKTRGDYLNMVPVIMNEARTRIVSYPDPSDLRQGDQLMKPVKLRKGFMLDNRGINENVAFLNMSYEEYSKLETPPNIYEMSLMILDKEPLTELYYCGLRSDYKNLIYELNVLIDRGLTNCRKANLAPMSVELPE